MKRVIILRGIPGCGKSTYAKSLPQATIVSADDFFVNERGKYKRVDEKLQEAHTTCLKNFLEALERGVETVVVDNTNINPVDIAPYYATALVYGYYPEVITISCPPAVAGARNVHDVPQEHVDQLARTLQQLKLPKRWNQRVLRPQKSV